MKRLTVKKGVFRPKDITQTQEVPLALSPVSAGFPSPADEYIEGQIDLNTLLIKNKPATYLIRVSGTSMIGAGIHDNDILVVDASRKPRSGQIVVVSVDGEFLVKRWCIEQGITLLRAENKNYTPIIVKPDDDVSIFGLVTGLVRDYV